MERPYCCWNLAWNRGRPISDYDKIRSISQTTLPLYKWLHVTPVDCCSPSSSNARSVHVSKENSRCNSQKGAFQQRSHTVPFKLRHHEVKQDDWQSRKKRLRSNGHCRPLWCWTLEIPWHSAPSPTSPCCVCVMLQLHYFCSCVRAENGICDGGEDGRGVAAWDILHQTGNVVCHDTVLTWDQNLSFKFLTGKII